MNVQLTYEATRRELQVGDLNFSYHEAGVGTPLLMLHGSGPGVSGWSNFAKNLSVFSHAGFRVIIPDLPGFGRTSLGTIDSVYPKYAALRVLEFMSALGIESAMLIGNSMGGSISGEMAFHAPERIVKMALMGPGGLAVSINTPDPTEGGKRLFEFLDDPTRNRMIAWVETMVADPRLVTSELIDERMSNALQPGAIENSKEIFRSINQPDFVNSHLPLWARASQIKTETLVVWGREDRVLLYDQAHFMIRQMPNVELHTFSRCGHWAQVEQKAAFERVVIEFLQRDNVA